MSLKRASDDTLAERPVQRLRLYRGDIETTLLSLDDINDHCILEVFKCLSVEDLNSTVGLLSNRYRDLRNHGSLDQTRTGTIVCTENTTLESIHNAFVAQGWNQVFTGNRTHLRVVGLERMHKLPHAPTQPLDAQYLLPNVTSLDMSFDPHADDRIVARRNNVVAFAWMLPNLSKIDLSYMILFKKEEFRGMVLSCLEEECHRLQIVIWNGSENYIGLDGIAASIRFYRQNGNGHQFTQLSFDNSQFSSFSSTVTGSGEKYPFIWCTRLERLSIMNATCFQLTREGGPAQPVSQEMLIKMVRSHASLRWLRSDLSEENIAMLQQERPGITFVSE